MTRRGGCSRTQPSTDQTRARRQAILISGSSLVSVSSNSKTDRDRRHTSFVRCLPRFRRRECQNIYVGSLASARQHEQARTRDGSSRALACVLASSWTSLEAAPLPSQSVRGHLEGCGGGSLVKITMSGHSQGRASIQTARSVRCGSSRVSKEMAIKSE